MKTTIKIFLILSVFLSCVSITCAIQKRQQIWYDFICWVPDSEGGESTISGRINDLTLQKDIITFTAPDGKKVLFSGIKCIFKESELNNKQK
jgi:hypothetical protein